MGGGGGGGHVTGLVSIDDEITEDLRVVEKSAGHVYDSALIAANHVGQNEWVHDDYWELRKALERLGQAIRNWEHRLSKTQEPR
jgi:hypothetical protein